MGRSPLNVLEVDGQLVTYDNRRLDAALESGVEKLLFNVLTLMLFILHLRQEKHGSKNSKSVSKTAEMLKLAVWFRIKGSIADLRGVHKNEECNY